MAGKRLYLRNGVWYYRIPKSGGRRISTGCSNYTSAIKWQKQYEIENASQIARGLLSVSNSKTTSFSEAIEKYLDQKSDLKKPHPLLLTAIYRNSHFSRNPPYFISYNICHNK